MIGAKLDTRLGATLVARLGSRLVARLGAMLGSRLGARLADGVPPCSDKSKRRTKTVKKTVEPRWNQSFMYPLPRRDFSLRALELTAWDQAHTREEDSCFLGEVTLTLT